MIGQRVTGTDGIPLDNNGLKLSKSAYQPPEAVAKLFMRCSLDYGIAWQLQQRPFDEFDGMSLLERARRDQQTFGTFVGCQYIAANKRWRWRGRKNTARNNIVGILAQILAAILVPTVFATDDQDNDSRECARAMKVMLEEHLRRADYEMKFMYMVLSGLVNPASFVQVEYVEAIQRVKMRLADGSYTVKEAVDDLLTGLNLNVVPIDELMLGDFYTFDLQRQPYLVRVQRISYDQARSIYAGKYFDKPAAGAINPKTGEEYKEGDLVDRFDFVTAGTTRTFLSSQSELTLFDIEWTEADQNMVQIATFYYRGEDLQVTWVGGVFMGNYDAENPNEIYNSNPFEHRRMTLVGDSWGTVPVYPYAKSGFEPLDPGMRFAYYKSAAAKEYWDDATLNLAHQLLVDGMHLDVIKPILISGIAKYDSQVIAPGAVASLPKDATVAPYQLGPNLAAAMTVLNQETKDMEGSTIANILKGQPQGGVTATATIQAINNAKRMLGVCGALTADLVRQVGDLAIDCIVQNTTVGEMQEQLPGALGMKYRTILARGKEGGRAVTHKIVMTDKYIGRKMTEAAKTKRMWELWHEGGGDKKDAMRIWEINPYQFARKRYSCFVDADEMVMRASGADKQRNLIAFNMLTDPRVAPFTDPESVVNDFAIEEYGGNDPDRYKRKGSADALMAGMGMQPPVVPGQVDPSKVGAVDANPLKVSLT